MSRIKWDQIGARKYKTGVDHGVLYLQKNGLYPKGVPWNGLTSVNRTPSGAEETKLYADNIQYLNMRSAESLGLTIECYTYPDEWSKCNGEGELAEGVHIGQQTRSPFGFSYRNLLGNDTLGDDYGYELNLIYGCSSAPSEQSNQTVNDSPEAATFSYEVSTTPVAINLVDPDGKPYKPSASITIDSSKLNKDKLAAIEAILYGTDGTFIPTTDTTMSSGTTYYELDANGSYVETKDTTMSSGKTYYECTVQPTDGRLPLPDELITLLAAG